MASDMLTVAMATAEPWKPHWDRFRKGEEPDRLQIYDVMREEGVDITLVDQHGRPLNPFFGMNNLYMGLDPVRAVQLLMRRNLDMILSILDSPTAMPLLLRPVSFRKPKVALWDFIPDEQWMPRRLLQNFVMPRLDHVFVLGTSQVGYIRERWGDIPTTVVLQHVDAAFWQPAAPSHGGPILAIGEDYGRDFDTLMRAIHDLDVDVIVKTRRQLLDMPGRKARVTQIRDRLSFAELRGLYEKARLVVVPLRATTNVSGVGSALEAMAMAKALVVSDNPAMRDYVSRESSLIVPVGDVGAMREAIRSLYETPEKREILGRAGRAVVDNKFDQPVFARQMAKHIRAALGR